MLRNLAHDVRYAGRLLARRPGFTFVAVLCLCVGIGASTAIFSIVQSLALRSFSGHESHRMVVIDQTPRQGGMANGHVWLSDFVEWQQQSRSFECMAVLAPTSVGLSGLGEPAPVRALRVSPEYGRVVGVEPARGRWFSADEIIPGQDRVVLVSDALWRRRFAADPGLCGRTIRLDGEPYTVLGIMPPGCRWSALEGDLWLPLDPRNPPVGRSILPCVARLRAGVSLAQAQAELQGIQEAIEEAPYRRQLSWATGFVMKLRPVVPSFSDLPTAILALWGAVGLVLLLACANVASLLLDRAVERRREMAVRMTLGATRAQLVGQLLVESLLLGLIAGGAGLLLAAWGTDLLLVMSPLRVLRPEDVRFDWRVLLFTGVVSLLTSLIFGLVPALQMSKGGLHQSLKDGGGRAATQGLEQRRLRSLLAVGEVALSLLLVVGAGLLISSFLRTQGADWGFSPRQLLTVRMRLPAIRYAHPDRQRAFVERLLERVQAMPGVQAAACASPGLGGNLLLEGEGSPPAGPGQELRSVILVPVTAGWLATMDARLIAGRSVNAQDTASSARVVMLNEAAVRRYWLDRRDGAGGGGPLGQWIRVLDEPRQVVGIVGDIREGGLSVAPVPKVYLPLAQYPLPDLTLLVRTAGRPMAWAAAARQAVAELDPDQSLEIRTMEEALGTARPGFVAVLMVLFAAVAVVLAATGVYGVMSHSVSQRTHEIGIRVALGAQPRDVVLLVLRRGACLTLAGIIGGLAASWALTRFLAHLLYGLSPLDPVTLLGAALLLSLVSLLACWLPARRAARLSPFAAIRCE